MQILKRTIRKQAQLSIVLLDWSVRESFHILHYLSRQTVNRELFEVIVIEYYSHVSPALQPFIDVVDTWMLMEIPVNCFYHKHLMYNAGIVLADGELVMIVDSDAMVRDNFVAKVLHAFQQHPNIVLHVDQFRNNRRDLYPFLFPTFDEVLGEGCINHFNRKTIGVCDEIDPLHTRNYGACMCARRDDLILIGGADEHVDYLGHICGPYEMTFRLVNHGRREMWLQDEFTYHTWHPGQAGDKDYIGPHDGRHVSARALEARFSGRILPFLENPAIKNIRLHDGRPTIEQSLAQLAPEERLETWSSENVPNLKPRLWNELVCRRPSVRWRLCKTFCSLFARQVREKIFNLRDKSREISVAQGPGSKAGLLETIAVSIPKICQFSKRMLEFCLYATHRSRECLSDLVAQGEHEVSFYGTDGIAEILYDLTFEIPVTVKNIYDDSEGKRFHAFEVLPVEACRSANEKLIITSLIGVEEKIRNLKAIGVSLDRIVVLQ